MRSFSIVLAVSLLLSGVRGYGGTLWRVVTSFVCAFTMLSIFLSVNYGIHLLREQQGDAARGFFLNVPIALAFLVVILAISYFLSRRARP